MNKRQPSGSSSKQVLVEAAVRVVAHEGWDALTNRKLEGLTGIDRTTVSTLWPATKSTRETTLTTFAFEQVRAAATSAADAARPLGRSTVNIGALQHSLPDLFRTSDAPTLMARVCAFAGLGGAQFQLADHFANERVGTIQHLDALCSSPSHRAEQLMDWYIAACAVFVTKVLMNVDELPTIGQLLGD
jgi:hypothetical protein